ncbi:MAG: hypothetical protein RJA36_2859 [Pseudomonadota bacterium]|jgi:hypothetical protein
MSNRTIIAAAALLASLGAAQATELGGSVYPHGTENFMAGALPPPGVYGMVFGNVYNADRLNDKDGKDLKVPGFKVHANVVAPRLVWVPGTQVLGGDLVAHVIAPLVDLKVSTPGGSQSKSGLGDLTVGVGVGHHYSPNLHSVAALDAYLPTGGYTKGDIANIGRNYAAIEPVYALSYIDPKGFNGDIKLGYLINQKNNDTDYRSGNEFHFDYAAGYGLGNGWTLGVGGYYKQQLTGDSGSGAAAVGDNKYRGLAIGPNVKYDSGKGWFVTAKWQQETQVRNGAQGNALWLKAVFPL